MAAAAIFCPKTLPSVGYVYLVTSPSSFVVATSDSDVVEDVPNKLFIPSEEHCANVLIQSGIWAWNKTFVVHSEKSDPHESSDVIHSVYASIHSILSNKFEVVDDAAATGAVLFAAAIFIVTVGIRRPDAAITVAPLTIPALGVAAKAAGIIVNTVNKLTVFLRNVIPLLHILLFYSIIKDNI